MTTLILASLALAIAILAFAHSIRMARWLDRVERRRLTAGLRDEQKAWFL